MSRAAWLQQLCVDNAILQARHKKLRVLCERAIDLLEDHRPSSTERFHAILNDLAAYAREQFHYEQVLLRQNNPAMLARHQAESAECELQLTDLLINASQGLCDKPKLLSLLMQWWSSRLLLADMELKCLPQ